MDSNLIPSENFIVIRPLFKIFLAMIVIYEKVNKPTIFSDPICFTNNYDYSQVPIKRVGRLF